MKQPPEPQVQLNIKIPWDTMQRLDAIVSMCPLSKAQLVRDALDATYPAKRTPAEIATGISDRIHREAVQLAQRQAREQLDEVRRQTKQAGANS